MTKKLLFPVLFIILLTFTVLILPWFELTRYYHPEGGFPKSSPHITKTTIVPFYGYVKIWEFYDKFILDNQKPLRQLTKSLYEPYLFTGFIITAFIISLLISRIIFKRL